MLEENFGNGPGANMTKFNDEVKEVQCLMCGAQPGEPCIEKEKGKKFTHVALLGFHKERVELRSRIPSFPSDMPELDATDKAVITYYAYIALCDSCSTKSIELFGKKFSSQEIQRTFAAQGLKQAKEDGLIVVSPTKEVSHIYFDEEAESRIIDSICGECNRPKSHVLHDADLGDTRYHEFKEAEHIANRHERRSPDYKRKLQ